MEFRGRTHVSLSPGGFFSESVPSSTAVTQLNAWWTSRRKLIFSSGSREENKGAPDEEDGQRQAPEDIHKHRRFVKALCTHRLLSAVFNHRGLSLSRNLMFVGNKMQVLQQLLPRC